jgi:PAS domain S-box-containing protein
MSDPTRAHGASHHPASRLILLIVAFLPIIANGIIALIAVNELRVAHRDVENTLEVVQALKQLDDLMDSSSHDEHGYRVFSDPALLAAYRAKQAAIPETVQRARNLLVVGGGNPTDLDQINSLIEQDRAASEALEKRAEPLPRSGGRPADLEASAARGNQIMDAINGLLTDQRQLLNQRLEVIASRNAVAFITILFGTGGGIALVGVIFYLIRRDLRGSEQLAAMQSGALQATEQRFRRIFEESPLGKLLCEPDGRITQANRAFCRMLGRQADELVGDSIAALAHVDDRELLEGAVRQGMQSDQQFEIRFVTRTSGIAWASVHLRQLDTSGERRRSLVALTEDITRQKRAEAELRQAQKMDAIGQLTGGIAHDFNNLLGVIIGNVEFLMESAHDSVQAEMAKEILDSALSGADLTRRLLAFARRQPLQPRLIDLNVCLPNHIAIVRRLLGESVTISTDLAQDLWHTRADPSQVGDALLNLAINARDAMPDGGNILIRTANVHPDEGQDDAVKPGHYVVLSVTDTGVGMAPELQERVVEPFFTTKAPGCGSGLGLSMVFGFAKQSGGDLVIESDPGRGTTVRLYLPRALGHEAPTTDKDDLVSIPRGSESILVVDDKPEMRAVARRHLVALGYRVSEAENGPAALKMLRQRDGFDLLFTDVVMPEGMTGHQLANAAKQFHPRLKVLFTTGYTQPRPDTHQCMSNDTIFKPYRRQQLATAVRAALEA